MRFLGVGDTNDLAAMYHGLAQRGHDVRVFVRDPACRDVYGGLLAFTTEWERELGWLREAGREGFVLFESAGEGATQDALRKEGFQVVGGCALGDRLEADRAFGQAALRAAGMKTAVSHTFTDYAIASQHIARHPGRYVLKFNGATTLRTRNYVGTLADGADVQALLAFYAGRAAPHEPVDFVLMEHVSGIEVGVGAFFNGRQFLAPACIDFEHKRFFPGDLGELTGETGTIVSYRHSHRLFDTVLAPLAQMLADGGYCGYINVNLMANEDGLWPLEFTSRFGYPGFAICESLHHEPWEVLFARLHGRDSLHLATHGGFAAGVVLTVPPFPYRHGYEELSKGMPVYLRPFAPHTGSALRLAEVALQGGQLVTAGVSGYLGVAVGTGDTPASANARALEVAQSVVVPNLRYRQDIGQRLEAGAWEQLQRWGWV